MQSYLSPMDGKRKKKGLWTAEEDRILMDYVSVHGTGRWNHIAKTTGLKRSGKSCRLRWMNYLCPSVKRGDFTEDEDDLIIRLHNLLGNRWALIAGRIPGRTDNQVKNYWNTHLSKKLGMKRNKYNVGGPSVIVSPPEEERDDPLKIPEDQTANITSGPQVKDGQENDAIRVYEPCEQIMSDCYIDSYLVYEDNLEVISPCLTELLDGFPHDLPWLGV